MREEDPAKVVLKVRKSQSWAACSIVTCNLALPIAYRTTPVSAATARERMHSLRLPQPAPAQHSVKAPPSASSPSPVLQLILHPLSPSTPRSHSPSQTLPSTRGTGLSRTQHGTRPTVRPAAVPLASGPSCRHRLELSARSAEAVGTIDVEYLTWVGQEEGQRRGALGDGDLRQWMLIVHWLLEVVQRVMREAC